MTWSDREISRVLPAAMSRRVIARSSALGFASPVGWLPYNIAAANSSGYNYASGRLDHQTYFKSIRVDQSHIEAVILERVFAAWIREAVLVEGYLPQRLRTVSTDWSHTWMWDGHEHVDPAKEASAQEKRLKNNTTTLAEEYARRGQDWEVQLRQRAKELALHRPLPGIRHAGPGYLREF